MPLPKSYPSATFRILTAAQSLGIPIREDIHEPTAPPAACGLLDLTVDETGWRHSTYDAFLPPHVMRRDNLIVCTNTVATRLDLDNNGSTVKVRGVYLEAATATSRHVPAPQFYAAAKQEVVLCAGAIATPQLLMLR